MAITPGGHESLRGPRRNRGYVVQELARTIMEIHGGRGREWLERLPWLLKDIGRRWGLSIGPPFANLSYHYVAPVTRADGTKAVLKAGVPNPEMLLEIAALECFNGQGIARLLASDAGAGVLLLERLEPGAMLSTLKDDQQATSIAADVMRQLWRPAPEEHSFPSIGDWVGGLRRLREYFGGTTGPLPPTLVERAESLAKELLASMGDPVLLHGDLHHFNILTSERTPWLAIDPKGLVGEPSYEPGAFLRNLLPDSGANAILERRIARFSQELGLDRERVLGWGIVQGVLSAWWSIEDHGSGWEEAVGFTESLVNTQHC